MADFQGDEDIRYRDLANQIFDSSGEQRLIPFLGAGVSLSTRPPKTSSKERVAYPDPARIENLLTDLGLEGRPRMFVAFAIAAAYMMAAIDPNPSSAKERDADLVRKLADAPYPPSVDELAQVFCDLSNHGTLRTAANGLRRKWPGGWQEAQTDRIVELLRLLVHATGLPDPGDSLTSICGYYETESGRAELWTNLAKIFHHKNTPTPTHNLIARAARHYLDCGSERVTDDYLIITANYDGLMEESLSMYRVPFAVLRMKKEDNKIYCTFCEPLKQLERRNPPTYPNLFHLSRRTPLVVVYKIHGCLVDGRDPSDDSVVISDNDYVDYISRMATNEGVVPAYVGNLLRRKPFLFLGYSLNDWNVRSMFQMIVRKRADPFGVRDYAVMRDFTKFEEKYCERNRVIILHTDLQSFVTELSALEPNGEIGTAGGQSS
jgi:hypothetical protein